MHIKGITKATCPKPADHGLRNDLSTLQLLLNVVEQVLGLVNKE